MVIQTPECSLIKLIKFKELSHSLLTMIICHRALIFNLVTVDVKSLLCISAKTLVV